MFRKSKVYLRGAYGPGNFGDDILLLCMISILKKHFKTSEIAVSVGDVKAAKAIDAEIMWLPINCPVSSDIAILGGGGQFFSFKKSDSLKIKKRNFFNFFSKKIKEGYTIIDLLLGFSLRLIFGVGYNFKKLAVFCIGVGPFENGKDSEFNRALKILRRADFISVRDSKSKQQVKEMLNLVPFQFTDISLNRNLWYNEENEISIKNNFKKKSTVGIVLRDWKFNVAGDHAINKLLDFEKDFPNYECIYISFYKKYDINVLKKIKDRKNFIWDPEQYTVNEFITKLKLCDVIVSTRAHGVLLPSMAYIPTIAVEIEPKLNAVHKMMPKSTRLIKLENLHNLHAEIDLCLIDNKEFKKNVDNDLLNNSSLASESINKLDEWLRNAKE